MDNGEHRTRRAVCKSVLGAAASAEPAPHGTHVLAEGERPGRRPNVVRILADDVQFKVYSIDGGRRSRGRAPTL